MGLRFWLEPPTLENLKIQVFRNTSHEQSGTYQEEFHCEPGVPHFEGQFAPMNFTAASSERAACHISDTTP